MHKRQRSVWALDNLEGMRGLDAESVALVYLDPPFNSGRNYTTVLSNSRGHLGETSHAFFDTWRWTDETDHTLRNLGEFLSKPVSDLVSSLARTLGPNPTTAYLVEMAPRLAELHRLLKHDGSIYVHCDPAASHYLRLLLDHIFGPENFRNEIIWKRTHAHNSSRRYGPVHDTILFYSKSGDYLWNPVFEPYADTYLEKHFRLHDENGNYQLITCTAPGDRQGTRAHYDWRGQLPPPGRHWAWRKEKMEEFERDGRIVHSSTGIPRLKRYSDEGRGVAVQDVWLDINRLDSHSRERIGFETQKPVALLERIIAASSKPGDLVLDPFAGSGTTAVAAERLKRQWISMDNSLMACAISLARVRQEVNLADVSTKGFPEHAAGARKLLRDAPAAFGIWGASMLGTVPDRTGTNSTVVVGSGALSTRSKSVEILSWVPIADSLAMSVPTSQRRRLSKLALILRHNSSARAAEKWLKHHVNTPIHMIDLADLVNGNAHRTGINSRLPDLLRKAA